MVELDVPGHKLGCVLQCPVVPHGHDVVEAEDADPLPRPVADAVAEPLARPVDEDLLFDPGRAVLADIACLAGEDDRRLAVERQEDVGVAVDDHEAGQVRHGALEARVLVARHDRRVEPVAGERLPDPPVPPLDLRLIRHLSSSSSRAG